jgi:CRP/FNR family transcriptional regulator, cyclic AMP receptor protein
MTRIFRFALEMLEGSRDCLAPPSQRPRRHMLFLPLAAQRSWNLLARLPHLAQPAKVNAEMLRRVYLFAECTERELRFLASRTDAVQAPAGEVLTVEGRRPDTFYMLLEGVVRVETAGEADVQYGPGAAFDVVAMAERSPARATITAEGAVRMLVMSRAQFRAVAALPRLQDALWRVTSPAAVAPPLQPRHPARTRV